MTELTKEQQLQAQLLDIQQQIATLEADKKAAATEELEARAREINTLVAAAKRKAHAAGLHFEYSSGYEEFAVYQWEQSDYC